MSRRVFSLPDLGDWVKKIIKMKKTLHYEEGRKLHWEEAEESGGRGRGWGLGGGRGLVAVLRAASQTPGLEN